MSYLALGQHETARVSPFYYMSNFEFILSGMVTDVGRLNLSPFKSILTSFKSISMISPSHSIFFFNLTCSGINFPVISNKCMLPAVLHNFTGMLY